MSNFDLKSINKALNDSGRSTCGVDFSGQALKLDTEDDAQPIIETINACPDLQYLTLTGNTLGVAAAQAIGKTLENHPELKICRWSDMFTGRMETEIPLALTALGDGMIAAGARLSVLDLSDNAFGPIGVEGIAKLLQSNVCSQLQELRLNNNGLGVAGGRLLADALSTSPLRLKVFVAGRNRLENEGAKALASVFQKMGTLEEIAMPQNGFNVVGISALFEAFKHNPQLSCLNLNENTVGANGAAAIANALPLLKKLKSIYLGNCLLFSKGAKTLAKAIQDNSLRLESLDISNNEISREACMEIVEAVTELPDSLYRLERVVLYGNSLGDSANKKMMRDKLGASAELSHGEDSDDEYVTDSENENSESAESDNSQNSGSPFDSSNFNRRDIDTAVVGSLSFNSSSGNSLGDSANKKMMRDKLGASAELSHGEDSDDEYVTDSENENSESAESDNSQNSGSPFDSSNFNRRDIDTAVVGSLSFNSSSGNSLGDSANKKMMRDKLGASAELSHGEDSDDEYVTDPEDENSETAESDNSQNSGSPFDSSNFNRRDIDTAVVRSLSFNSSSDDAELLEVETDVKEFLAKPTIDNLRKLGPNAAEVIDSYVQAIKEPSEQIRAYVEATFMVSGLTEMDSSVQETALQLYPILVYRAGQHFTASAPLANAMLKGLGLIKPENKEYKIRWHLPACYIVLAKVMQTLPTGLRNTIQFFIAGRMSSMSEDIREVVQKHPVLYST